MEGATTHRDVRRVLIAGDTHGNTKWVKHLTEVAARNDCPVIIQAGDFGYFPDHRDGPRFLSAVDQACAANGVELWFIDGNHDDGAALVCTRACPSCSRSVRGAASAARSLPGRGVGR